MRGQLWRYCFESEVAPVGFWLSHFPHRPGERGKAFVPGEAIVSVIWRLVRGRPELRRRALAPPWPAAGSGPRIWGVLGPVVKRPTSSSPLHVYQLRRRCHCVRTPPLPQLLLASSLRVWFARLLCSTCEEGIGLVGLACFSSVALCFRA